MLKKVDGIITMNSSSCENKLVRDRSGVDELSQATAHKQIIINEWNPLEWFGHTVECDRRRIEREDTICKLIKHTLSDAKQKVASNIKKNICDGFWIFHFLLLLTFFLFSFLARTLTINENENSIK